MMPFLVFLNSAGSGFDSSSRSVGPIGQESTALYTVVHVECESASHCDEWGPMSTLTARTDEGVFIQHLTPDAPPQATKGGGLVWTSTLPLAFGVEYRLGGSRVFSAVPETVIAAENVVVSLRLVPRQCDEALDPVDIGAWSKAVVRVSQERWPEPLLVRRRWWPGHQSSWSNLDVIAEFTSGYIATEACADLGYWDFYEEHFIVTVDFWNGRRHKGTIHRWVHRDALEWEDSKSLVNSALGTMASNG
jgi:hypothetical protein